MAKQVRAVLVDDIDGGPATETIRFGIDGRQYTIDLNHHNAQRIRAALDEWIKPARRDTAKRKPTRKTNNTQAIREWATMNGHPIAQRGRISDDIIAAYNAATRA